MTDANRTRSKWIDGEVCPSSSINAKRMAPGQPVCPMSRRRKSRVAPKGVQARSWVALMASKGTPAAVVATLNRSVNDVLRRPKSPKSSRPLALCQIR
ncbi:MAG: hypothetical protein E6H76_00185 [Betaproteobacteria bacterium]|nr:MAG: hypothetical protein E6H76_00185 [Betaproteobacteria bacterium]TMH24342.1 MAG: hypothetical protein E6H64_01385 [Betaproteobacteria bacterium]TMI07553.1 MAG: hypothetical protein E6H46_03280 [Betaproteobacteria bacterium]